MALWLSYVTSHFQRIWWVGKWAIHNLLEYPLVCSLGEMCPVPVNLGRWIIAWFSKYYLFAIDNLPGSTLVVQVIIIFPTMTATCYEGLLKSYKYFQSICASTISFLSLECNSTAHCTAKFVLTKHFSFTCIEYEQKWLMKFLFFL